MGLRNLRAICPSCGAKIHTQAKGLGHITWANTWFLARTGTECPYCGVALTGKVTADGKAVAAGQRNYGIGAVVHQAPQAPPGVGPVARYRVTTAEGDSRVFDSYTSALMHKSVHGGELTRL